MNARRPALAAAALSAVAAVAWAQNALKAGEYEVTLEMLLPGASEPTKQVQKDCVTPAQASDFHAMMRAEMEGVEGCTFSEPVTAGNKTTWTTTCDDLTAKTEFTFLPDGFTAATESTVGGEKISGKVTGKWLSATCSAPSP